MTKIKRLLVLVILSIMVCLSATAGSKVYSAGETSPILKADGTNLKFRGTNTNVMGLTNYEYKTQDFRAAWVASVQNLDVAKLSSNSQADIDSYKAQLTDIINNMKLWGMNALIFQIRPMNDAFYDSTLNHISRFYYQGNDLEWDMLSWLIDQCHQNGIEFHAWLNPYRVESSGVTSVADYAQSVAEKNALYGKNNLAADPSSLLLTSAGGLIYNPGEPKVRQFLIDTVREIVENYDVDGIHFDDYFYANLSNDADDNITMQQNPISGITNKADWRREQVTTFVRDLSTFLKNFNTANSKAVQLGISPTGIWRNSSNSSLGSNTAGFEHYGPYLYADTRKWVKENLLDYILPQTYWGLEHTTAPFADLAKWWAETVRGTQVNLYLGNGLYMETENRADWVNKPNEIENQLKVMGVYPEIKGYSFYRYQFVRDVTPSLVSGYNGVQLIKNDYWKKHVSNVPLQRYPDLVSAAPSEVQLANSTTVTWPAVSDARGYNVYRVAKGTTLNVNNASHLYTYTAQNTVTFDTLVNYDVYVASLSRANNISAPVKLGAAVDKIQSVVDQINALPNPVSYTDQQTVTAARNAYNALTSTEQASVTNYNKLQTAETQLSVIISLKDNVATPLINSVPRQIITDYTLPTGNDAGATVLWRYASGEDQSVYDINSGTILFRKIPTSLRRLEVVVQKDGLTYVGETTVNFGWLPESKTGLYYYNMTSSIFNDEPGTPSNFLDFSGKILEINNNVLFIPKGQYIELTDTSNLIAPWVSCAVIYKNVSTQDISFAVANSSISATAAGYGYLIIGTDNRIKETNVTYATSTTITLAPNEYLFAPKYLDALIAGSPFKPVTKLLVGDVATVTDIMNVDVSVDDVIAAISALPEVVSLADEPAVSNARNLYNALSTSDKALVTNYDALVSAEQTISQLKAEAQLNAKKATAISQLQAIKLTDYSTANQALVTAAINDGIAAINACTTTSQVDLALQQALSTIDEIKTLADEEAELLVQQRADAIADLNSYVVLSDYSQANQALITTKFTQAATQINQAANKAAVDQIVTNAKNYINSIDTIADEAALLQSQKNAAKVQLATYLNGDNYSAAGKLAIAGILANANAGIDNAASLTDINAIVAATKTSLDSVLTLAEENTAKNAAKAELERYPFMDDYSEAKQLEIEGILVTANAEIDNAASLEAIASIVADAKVSIDEVLTKAEEDQAALELYIDAKIKELNDEVDLNDYSETDKVRVQEILDRFETDIRKATSESEAASITRAARTEIAAIEKLPETGCNFISANASILAIFTAIAMIGYLILRRK